MEGRDIGTVVFPDADVKFFLDASLDVRARRLGGRKCARQGHGDTLEEVRRAIAARDEQDRTRTLAPLVPAADAHVIDTADFSIDAVVRLWYQRRNTTFCGVTVESACAPWP